MDNAEPTVARPMNSAPPPSSNWVMGRALASAAVFGFIGQWIGKKLGHHISNKVAEPLLKWSMGSFWAALAAYSSLRASAMERGELVAEFQIPTRAPVDTLLPVLQEPKEKAPLSLIEVDSLMKDGHVQETPQLQRN